MDGAGPSCCSLLSSGEKVRLQERSLLLGAGGDSDATGSLGKRRVAGPWPCVQGRSTKSDTCLQAFLFIFILKEKKQKTKNSAKTHFPVSAMPTPHPQVTPLALPPAQHPFPLMQPRRGWRLHSPGVPDPWGSWGEARTGGAALDLPAPCPGLRPWHQAPLLALINPFLITLLA